MKILLVVFALVALAVASELDDQWDQFKAQHDKYYTPKYELLRKRIFAENVNYINKHNVEAQHGLHSYVLGVNQFADLTNKEFKELNRFRVGSMGSLGTNGSFIPTYEDIPASVDWTTKGAVTEVKNQGQCGSCWAFSATGSLEGQYFLKTKKLVSLSEQELVDCTGPEGNQGCNGGLMDQAFKGIQRLGGIESEADYPYTGSQGSCQFDAKKKVTTVTGFKDIPTGDEKALTEANANIGPISVAIDASSFQFQFYMGGVFDYSGCKNGEQDLDHGVTLVGYGNEGGKDFYLVKNSWTSAWGVKGYIKMSRNKNNQCGIATAASYPLL